MMAPAAAAYLRSSTSPRATTNANTRSLLYFRMLLKSPGLTPPKAMAARVAKPIE